MINRDQGSPNISKAKLIGQSERLRCVCFMFSPRYSECSCFSLSSQTWFSSPGVRDIPCKLQVKTLSYSQISKQKRKCWKVKCMSLEIGQLGVAVARNNAPGQQPMLSVRIRHGSHSMRNNLVSNTSQTPKRRQARRTLRMYERGSWLRCKSRFPTGVRNIHRKTD